MNHTRLMKMLNVTQSDLDANRSGRLSERQIRLNMRRAWISVAALVLGGIAAGVFMVFSGGPEPAPVNVLLGAVVALAAMGLAAYTFALTRRTLSSGSLESVTGEAAIEYRSAMRAGTYILIVAGREFLINEPMSKAIVEGATYTIYHLPTERRLLSADLHG